LPNIVKVLVQLISRGILESMKILIVLGIAAVLIACAWLVKVLNTNSLEDSIDDAKKKFFPAQMKKTDISGPGSKKTK
jgi:hypothetical protein